MGVHRRSGDSVYVIRRRLDFYRGGQPSCAHRGLRDVAFAQGWQRDAELAR